MEDCPQNFIVAVEASVLGQLFIYRDIFQHRALSPARRPRGLCNNYSESLPLDIRVSPAREVKMSHKSKILMRSLGIAGKLFSYPILQKQRIFFLDLAGKTSSVLVVMQI